eukprot:scaffold28355_cov57-Phaeocystis_antarctica.AAC.3
MAIRSQLAQCAIGNSVGLLGVYCICISMFIMTWVIPSSTASSSPRSSSPDANPASFASSARSTSSARSSSERTSSAERVGAIAVATPLGSRPAISSDSPASSCSTQFRSSGGSSNSPSCNWGTE